MEECAMYYVYVLSHFSHVWLFVIPWTVACQAPLSMGFSSPEYWRGLPFLSPGDLPDPGIKPEIDPSSLMSPALAGRFFTTSATREARYVLCVCESLSHFRLFATPWTVACQASLPMNFSRQECWSA